MAGEGSFTTKALPPYEDGSERKKFVFCVTVARHDRPVLEALATFLGRGAIRDAAPRRDRWLPTSTFDITSQVGHRRATIPFADRYLLPSAKRDQFEAWWSALDRYERAHPSRHGKGRSECSVEGCTRPVRGRGVCRQHYYQLTGY